MCVNVSRTDGNVVLSLIVVPGFLACLLSNVWDSEPPTLKTQVAMLEGSLFFKWLDFLAPRFGTGVR